MSPFAPLGVLEEFISPIALTPDAIADPILAAADIVLIVTNGCPPVNGNAAAAFALAPLHLS